MTPLRHRRESFHRTVRRALALSIKIWSRSRSLQSRLASGVRAHSFAVQEHRLGAHQFQEAQLSAAQVGWKGFWTAAVPTDKGSFSGGAALLTPKCVGLFEFEGGQMDILVWPGRCVAGVVEAGATGWGGLLCYLSTGRPRHSWLESGHTAGHR